MYRKNNKILYNDISADKDYYILLIKKMQDVYAKRKLHTSVLECDYWINVLNMQKIPDIFNKDALLNLKNIMNDAANYLVIAENNFDMSEKALTLMNKIYNLFK